MRRLSDWRTPKMSPNAYEVASVTADAPTMEASSSSRAKIAPIPGPMCFPIPCATPSVGVAQRRERQHEQRPEQEHEHRALPAPEVAADGDADQDDRRQRHDHVAVESEVFGGQRHADELRADDHEVQKEQAAYRVPAPEAAEALGDELGKTDAGDGAEPDDHLLVDDQDRHQQEQRPEQRVAEVLAGLRVGGDAARVVVAYQNDNAGPDDRREGEQPSAPRSARHAVLETDCPEGALD